MSSDNPPPARGNLWMLVLIVGAVVLMVGGILVALMLPNPVIQK